MTKQKDAKSLQNYTKIFRIATEVLESPFGGPIIISKNLSTIKEYIKFPTDAIEQENNQKYQDQVFGQFLAYIYLQNSYQSKYRLIFAGLITQQSSKNNQHPKTITEANNILSNHKFDTSKHTNKNKNKSLND
jgi:hypothetical protein